MNFIIYENAQPILEEYPASTALKMLLEKHGDEFPEHYIDAMATAAEMCITITEPQLIYLTYVSAVVQMRMDIKQSQELTTFSF